jgi:hypothetical protein
MKPGPNQQRGVDNFLLPQVKWGELYEGAALQARQQWLSEGFRLGLAIGISLQGGRKFSAGCENFPSVFLPFVPPPYPYFSMTRNLGKPCCESTTSDAPLCRYSSGLPIAEPEGMLSLLKRRFNMSPFMLMVLLSLVPFPILAVAILADRWIKQANKAAS